MYGTDTDAQVLATLPLFVTSVGLFGACKLFIRSTSAAYLAVGVFLSLGPINDTLGYAYIDNLLALYSWAATLALAIWLRNPRDSNTWLIICGVLMGTAAGTKLFGAVLAVFVGLYLLLVIRQWRVVLIYAFSTLLFGIGWYVRSFYISGDPVHPAGGNYFGHYLWNAADLLSQVQEQSTHGAVKNPFSIFKALQVAGLSILIPALGVMAQIAGRRRPVLFLYIVFVLYLVFWLLSAQVARYLAPVFALGSFLSVLFLYQAGLGNSLKLLEKHLGERVLKTVAVLGVLVCAVSLGIFFAKPVSEKLANWDSSLAARSGFKVMEAANSLKPQYGDKLMQLGFENAIYFFKGTVIGDWFGPGRYSNMILCAERCQLAPAGQIVTLMKGFNAQMLAVNAKRFQFEPEHYKDLFEIKFQTNEEFLLVLKK
jgi:4-amino-4-deoxy-L-arabinose transferase-like glycosyltransferase